MRETGRLQVNFLRIINTAKMSLPKDPATIKIAIGCPNHLYGEGLKKILEEEGMEVIEFSRRRGLWRSRENEPRRCLD